MMRPTSLLGLLALCPMIVTAQQSPDTRINASLQTALAPVLDSARLHGLPTEPLIDKALEGVSKQASNALIVVVVRHLSLDLASARDALGTAASTAELVAGASAIKAGIRPVALTQMALAMRHGQQRSLVVSLAVLSELVARGVPADTAASTMLALAEHGAQDEALVAFREDVEREIAAGVLPGAAAVDGVPAPDGIVASSALRSPPPLHPTSPTPIPPK